MAEITLNGSNFEEEDLRSVIPVIVDFWASWCGPCKMMNPVIAGIAEEYEGKIKVGKVNVDENPELAAQFKVFSIPTVIGFVNGEIKSSLVGFTNKENVLALIK